MELEVPKRPPFTPTFTHCHGPMSFAMGEAKEILSLQMSGDHDREMPCITIIIIIIIICQTFSIVMRKAR